MAEMAKWVEDGPDLAKDGVVRWRRADLRDRIMNKFAVKLHERSVGKLLHKWNFSSITVRPLHPKTDLAAQETFKKTSPIWHEPRSRRSEPVDRSKSGFRMKPGLVRGGRLGRDSVSPSISGSPAGWLRSVPLRVGAQGGRSPTGATTRNGGENHAAAGSGRWLK
jgi:hypothetical protein